MLSKWYWCWRLCRALNECLRAYISHQPKRHVDDFIKAARGASLLIPQGQLLPLAIDQRVDRGLTGQLAR